MCSMGRKSNSSGFLEEDVKFFEGLEHNMEVALPDKVKSSLSNHFESLKREYEAPNFFPVNSSSSLSFISSDTT